MKWTPQTDKNYADDDRNGIDRRCPRSGGRRCVLAQCNSLRVQPDLRGRRDHVLGTLTPEFAAREPKPAKGTPERRRAHATGCNEFIHTPATEAFCNGIDDDCNGRGSTTVLDNDGPCDDMPPQSLWPDGDLILSGSRRRRKPHHARLRRVHPRKSHVRRHELRRDHGCADAGDQCFPSQPTPETQQFGAGCDGLDNDCNGIDDDHACADSDDVQFNDSNSCHHTYNEYFCTDLADTTGLTCIKAN